MSANEPVSARFGGTSVMPMLSIWAMALNFSMMNKSRPNPRFLQIWFVMTSRNIGVYVRNSNKKSKNQISFV